MYARTAFQTVVCTLLPLVLIGFLAPTAVPADTISYVPASGGPWSTAANWDLGHRPQFNDDVRIVVSGYAHKAVSYDWTGGEVLSSITIDGSASGYYGAIWHMEHALTANNMCIGNNGPGWHWMEGPAHLWVDDNLYVGYVNDGPGHFYLATMAPDTGCGLLVYGILYVGYQAPGDFDHTSGAVDCDYLYVGQNDTGVYELKGTTANSRLNVVDHAVIGNADEGTFEQTGGTFNHNLGASLKLGLNAGGVGTYLMRDGELNAGYISVAWNGNGYFTQSGGTVDVTGNVTLGCTGTSPHQAWYKLNQDDGTAELSIGYNLVVGPHSSAKYEQTAGTATIGGDLGIYSGDSEVYLSGGVLEVNGTATNHGGLFDQDGGVMSTSHFINDSASGINLDYTADFRATTFEHNSGVFYMWRDAQVRGEQIMPGVFFMCNFTNDAVFQMGNASYNGGTFTGHFTNNGSFNYGQGDFSGSTFTNNGTGTVYLGGPFTCNRFVQNAYSFTVTPTAPITANGTGYANAFESNGNLTIEEGASITVVDAPLVSNEAMYARGTVTGDVENNDYLLPATGGATGQFYIDGDFTQSSTGMLRVRLGGTWPITEFDRLRLTGHATLGGTLQVLLIDEFTPDLGDTFRVVVFSGGRTGEFDTHSLPALPNDWEWDVRYLSGMLQLDVVEPQVLEPGDMDCDGDVDFDDIDPFVLALGGQAGYETQFPDCHWLNADCDEDGNVDFDDIDAFVALIGS